MPKLTQTTFDYRHKKISALMDTLQVDALIFTSADFFQFATNFATDVQPWERPILAVIPREGPPFLIMNELSTNHVRFSIENGKLWITDISFYAEHPKVANRLPLIGQLHELVADRLQGAGLARSLIGVEGGSPVLTAAGRLLPGIHFRPSTPECRALRWQKNEEELRVMEAAAKLSDWVQDRYRESIRPGRLVQELDCAMASLFVQEAAERFAGEHFEVIRTSTLSGQASASPHGDGASCGQRIKEGDVLVNSIIPRLNGLAVENERTWFCGKPTAQQAALWTVAKDANEAAVAATRTGNPVSASDAAAQAVIEKAGFGESIKHRTGHAIGVLHHEYPEDMAFSFRRLLKNEVYSAQPGLYVHGIGGFRLGDTLVVGREPRALTHTPHTLEYATVA
ncbi:Xaa-Pro peptidase family protein [Ramlibacter sp.]|uniref:M24 family metallopeptidase n=1 Tax=Ramlibacter sp. TaxID=1917967 RepID=UPI002638A9C3|nr:Xaa-Pro peptidase family protein [Ramlibacter sp.]MDB5955516.1 aminopeptidase family protein [Ramlibacter sp.]